jgi:hygromycin-B 7''-O-kinase
MTKLPDQIDPAYFHKAFRLRPARWQEAVRDLCRRHRLPFQPFQPFSDGSNLVAGVGERWIVKIFPPFHRHQWESEHRVLRYLNGRVEVPIPELPACGEAENGWTFVIITRLSGESLETAWPQCTPEEKAGLLRSIGRIMAQVHALPVGELHSLEPHWEAFLAGQVAGALHRHRRLGMPDWFLDDLDRFLRQAFPLLPERAELVILTGEYTPFNLLVEGEPGKRRIAGMIDFGDAMTGFREYDLLGPILFLAQGDAVLTRAFLKAYGYDDDKIDAGLRRRLMVLALLHRYSNFTVQVRIPGWQERTDSLENLEKLIFDGIG